MQPNIPTAAAVEPAANVALPHDQLGRLAQALARCAQSAYQARNPHTTPERTPAPDRRVPTRPEVKTI
jgi:hypothetical protein